MRRKNLHLPSYYCVLCADSSEETVEHLFLKFGFAKECWFRLGLTVDDYLSPFQVLESFRFQLALPFFMEILIIMSWSTWTIRNDAIFRGIQKSSQKCLEVFKQVFGLLLWCTKRKYFPAIELWLEHIV
jgi:hypothetical protein